MSKEDLIDISTRPDFKEITARGGRAKSVKKTTANRIKALKWTKPENLEKKYLEIVRNPEVSALQIASIIGDMLKNETLTQRTKVELIGKMVQAHTAIHGAKSKNINLNVDVQLDTIIDKWREKRKEIIKIEDGP